MLIVDVPMGEEMFNQESNEFFNTSYFPLRLEHSLVSVSKWESFFEKPFLNDKEKTTEETRFYVEAMALDEELPPGVFDKLTSANVDAINKYITAKRTATWFNEKSDGKVSGEMITSELIYYWMISLQIDFQCQYWHLNRLLTLIRVCNHKNSPPKKMSQAELLRRNRQLNEERRAKYKTSG